MIGPLPQADHFKQQIRESFRKQSSDCRLVRVAKNDHVYVSGDQDQSIYFIHMGRIKLLLPSPEAKECLFAIKTAGDLFGILCLAGQTIRLETAVAMEDTCLKQIPARNFLTRLRNESLLEGLVQYLTVRIAEQEEVIATLATLNSEKRLACTLIQLARVLGQPDPQGTRIAQRISQNELAEMVGTTRTRIGVFLKRFRDLGLIGVNADRCLVVNCSGLKSYLDHQCSEEREIQCPMRHLAVGSRVGTPRSRYLPDTETAAVVSPLAESPSYP